MPSLQETFDTVVHAAAKQRRPGRLPLHPYDNWYRINNDPKGDRCFIGHLIPDESYRPEMEGEAVGDDVRFPNGVERCQVSLLLDFLGHDLGLCAALQHAHDYGKCGEDWEDELRGVANGFNLNTDAVDQYDWTVLG